MGELEAARDKFDETAELLKQVRELRENIRLLLHDSMAELETMVELGCQFYAKALVPDTSKIFIDVGLGFHLEMPLEDAVEFLDRKEEHLLSKLELCKNKTTQVKADIHEALH